MNDENNHFARTTRSGGRFVPTAIVERTDVAARCRAGFIHRCTMSVDSGSASRSSMTGDARRRCIASWPCRSDNTEHDDRASPVHRCWALQGEPMRRRHTESQRYRQSSADRGIRRCSVGSDGCCCPVHDTCFSVALVSLVSWHWFTGLPHGTGLPHPNIRSTPPHCLSIRLNWSLVAAPLDSSGERWQSHPPQTLQHVPTGR